MTRVHPDKAVQPAGQSGLMGAIYRAEVHPWTAKHVSTQQNTRCSYGLLHFLNLPAHTPLPLSRDRKGNTKVLRHWS